MKNTKYEKFMEGYNKKIYISTTAEYKRNIHKSVKGNISAKAEVVFKEIMKNFLKGSNHNDDNLDVFFEGDFIKTKEGNAFITEYRKNKIFAYMTKGKNEKGVTYNTTSFEIKGTNRNYCVLTYTYTSKLPSTVTGMNGQLGSFKFKKGAKKHGEAVITFLKNKLESNN